MAKVIPVSTFKIFRHNFWTNEWSRFLYEGHYYRFKESDIQKVTLIKKDGKTFRVQFLIPRVWIKEYKYGVSLAVNQFPKTIQTSVKKYDTEKNSKEKVVREVKVVNQIKKYFVKKIAITTKQAKVLMKIQSSDMSAKRTHLIHKRIGLN